MGVAHHSPTAIPPRGHVAWSEAMPQRWSIGSPGPALSRHGLVEEEAVDHPIPGVPVTVTILVVSVAVVFTVWVPVMMYRAAIRHGRSTREALTLAGAPL